jgi:hypothetical protein
VQSASSTLEKSSIHPDCTKKGRGARPRQVEQGGFTSGRYKVWFSSLFDLSPKQAANPFYSTDVSDFLELAVASSNNP